MDDIKKTSFLKTIADAQPARLSFLVYLYFIFHKERRYILILFVLSCLLGAVPSVDSVLLQHLTDNIEYYSDNNIFGSELVGLLFKWIFFYALWWELMNGMWRLYDYCYLKALPRVMAHVTDELYDYVQYHSHRFFQHNLAGNIANRISEASKSFEMIFAYVNEKVVKKTATLLFAILALYFAHPIIALIFTTWLLIFVCLSLSFSKRINQYSRDFSQNKAHMVGRIVDAIANIGVVRMFASHRYERSYLNQYIDRVRESDQKMQVFMLKLRYVLGISCSIMIGCMVYYIIVLRSENVLSTGQCVLVITLCLSISEDIWDLTQEFGDLFEYIGAFNQSMTLLQEYQVKDRDDAKELVINEPSIEFRNVTFKFSNSSNSFENQSLMIPARQRVGLAGFSGAGKSTFASLIYRLRDIYSGVIFIDGQDISAVSQDSLHNNISVIPQEPILFHRTVRENICYGSHNVSEEQMIEASKAAHLHELITQLPLGYDTICGERGNNFSGGQRQRIIIARAFLKKAPIIILDEATSALDNYTEGLIQESLGKLMQGKTVIVIAHRLSTLKHMDRILVFDNGHVVEDGTHQSLSENSEFYKLLLNSL
jgi:ABC-type multidrug transport system fused ATPase/permease subunit